MDLDGTPMLRFMLDRLRPVAVDQIVVATTDDPVDDPVVAVAHDQGVPTVRGPEHDVLARFGLVMEEFPSDHVVRLTADCPLVDASIVHDALELHQRVEADYTSNTLVRTFPDGLDVEVIASPALRVSAAEATAPEEREHVTPFVYRRPARFRLRALCSHDHLGDERWTVDTLDDLQRIRQMVERVPNPRAATWRQILEIVGRDATSERGRVQLQPTCDDDWLLTRSWQASVDGIEIAQVHIDIRDGGLGRLRYRGPAEQRSAVVALVHAALTADKQIARLTEENQGS
jgi:spore coat polysaccharide biosynthesis protein SpsF